MLESLPKQKIRDVIVERIKSHIISEGLVPGDRLPTESALADQFGVSRLSLREATKALELLGILESKTGVGLTVGHIDMARVAGHLGFHPVLHSTPKTELIDTRIVIETGALPYAFRNFEKDPTLLESLQQIINRFRLTRDLQEWIELDLRFHRELLNASGLNPLVAFNDVLEIFFQQFRDNVKSADWEVAIERHQRTINSHQRIVDAIRQRNLGLAIEELRNPIEAHKMHIDINN